ncbi:hypothetical protein DRF75_02445, partial [Ehrlichia minasensis]
MKDYSSLHDAVKSGDLLKVKKFLDSANSASKGRALHSSVDGTNGILQYIIKMYKDTNDHKYIEMFDLILRHCNSDIINSQDVGKNFPLLMAAKAGYVFLNKFQKHNLSRRSKLSQEVDWGVVDVRGRNVLFNAILSNDHECCDIVFNQKSADQYVHSVENDGSNILHCLFGNYAAEPGQREVVNLVINKLKSLYVDGNKKSSKVTWLDRLLLQNNRFGETPLHLLVQSDLVDDLKHDIDFREILSKGDLLQRTKSDDTVISLAIKHSNYVVLEVLLGSSPKEYLEGVRNRKDLINKCKSDQVTECMEWLLKCQKDISKLASEEYTISNELYDNFLKACLERLKSNEERKNRLISKVRMAQFKLDELKINAEAGGLSNVNTEDLEKEIRDCKAAIQMLGDSSNNIAIVQKKINSVVDLNHELKAIVSNFSKVISEVKEPLNRVMLAEMEQRCKELLQKYEDKKICNEELLSSLGVVKLRMSSQVLQDMKEKSAASQKIIQQCLNQISKMREILPHEAVTRSFDEKLEDLEKDCDELMAEDRLLVKKHKDLKIKEVLEGQLLLRSKISDELTVLQDKQQTSQVREKISLLNKQLECVHEILDLTNSMSSMRSQIESIKKESLELDKKEQLAKVELSGMSLTRELRNLVAYRIALIQSQTSLEESIIRDIMKQRRIAGGLSLEYGLRAPIPVCEMLIDDLDLGRIQSNRVHLLEKNKLRLQVLERMVSDAEIVVSKNLLSEQLKEQQNRLKQVENDRRILQQTIRNKQESGKVGGLSSELSLEIQQLKQSEENLGKRINIIKAAIDALKTEIEKSNIQQEIQELKYALFENLTDSNFSMLLHCKEMFGSYSTSDTELISRVIKGYKRFSDVESADKYYAICVQLGVDIGTIRHAVESRNVNLLSAVIDEENPDVKNLGDGIIKIRDVDFLLSVLTDVKCAFDAILYYVEQEGLTYMHPELVIAMLISQPNSIRLHDILANSGDLFDRVLEESSFEQLSELSRLMRGALSTQLQYDNVVILKNKIVDFAFKCISNGGVDKLKSLIDGNPTLVYSEKDGKNLLEVASDLSRQDLVRYIISVHKKLIVQAKQDYAQDRSVINTFKMSFNNISRIDSGYVIGILKENKDFIDSLDKSVRDELISDIFNNSVVCGNAELSEYCTRAYPALVEQNKKVKLDPAQLYGARSKIRDTSAVDSARRGGIDSGTVAPLKITVNEFGALSQYVAAVADGDVEKFKREILDTFSSNPSNYAKRSHGHLGHSIFTLMAAFGNPKQWDKLENGYNNIKNERKTKDAFSSIKSPLNGNRMATVCSPLQAAVIRNNVHMIQHFLKKIDPQELKEAYGDSHQNIFHTCILSQQPDLTAHIMRDKRFPLDVLVSAFLQPDEKGITPFAMALQQGYKKICMDFIDRVENSKTQVRNLMTNEVFIKNVIDSKDSDLLERLFKLKYYATESKSDKYTINLKRHRIVGHSLFAYACKQNDENFVKCLTKYYTEQELLDELTGIIDSKLDVNIKILETILSAIVAETTDPNLLNKIFNKVISSPTAFEAFISLNPESYNRILEENFSIDRVIELNNPILLKGLIRSGREVFKLRSGKALSDLGLAVCFNDLLDVCHDYLRDNPEEILHGSVLPHGAILSNHVELLKQLIEKDGNLLIKQYDVKLSPYKEIAAQLKKNYGCEFRSSETIYDFAVREGADVEVINCIKDALLKQYSQLLNEAKLKKVDGCLLRVVLSNADEVYKKYPDLYGYVIEQFNVENFIRSAHPKKDNIFHSVDKENVAFLSEIVAKVYKHAVETGNKKKLSALVNQVRDSDGLSFFQYAALHGDYRIYQRIKPCGDIASKTANGANIVHLCAQSAMKDDEGIFEIQNLLKENGKLAEVSDKKGRGLLDYAASSRVPDFRLREEIFEFVLSRRVDKSITRLPQKSYDARVMGAIFASRNVQLRHVLLKRLVSEERVGETALSKILLNVIKNTSDPVEKARLLAYQAKLEEYKDILSSGESQTAGRESPSSAFPQTVRSAVPQSEAASVTELPEDEGRVELDSPTAMTRTSTQVGQSDVPQSDATSEPLTRLPEDEESVALGFPTTMTGTAGQAVQSAAYQSDSEMSDEEPVLKTSTQVVQAEVHQSDETLDPLITLPDEEEDNMPSLSSQVVMPFDSDDDYSVDERSHLTGDHERTVDSQGSKQLGAFSDEEDLSDDLLPESEIIVSSSKKAILDSQSEIESLIRSGDTSRCIRAINSAPSALVFQHKTLSSDLSIIERAFLRGDINLIESCMNSGRKLNPNVTDGEGNNMLHQFVGYFERDPKMLLNVELRHLFLRLCMDYGFDINHKNNEGRKVFDRLSDLVKGLNDSEVDLESSGIDEFMSSLLAHSRMSDQEEKNLAAAQNNFFARDSVYSLSNLVENSGILQNRFSNVFYDVCERILSEEASKYKDVADTNYSRLNKILNDKCLRKTLANTDGDGNNVLQKLCQDIASGKINARNDKVLKLFETIISALKDKDKELLEDLLFNNRNSRLENCIEAIPRIPCADVLFKKLEELLGKKRIAELCDFNSMLVNCAESGNGTLYDYLRTNYAVIGINNVDIHGNSSLCKAVITGSQDAVRAVLSTGTNINRKDKNGNTPLHALLIFMMSNPELVREQHVALVKFLASRGALLNTKNKMSISPIMLAESIDNEGKLAEKFANQKVSVLESLIAGKEEYLGIKSKCESELKPFVKLGKGMKYEDVRADIVGGVLSADMCSAKLRIGQLLNGDFCKTHGLNTVKFNFSNENRGYVQSVGKKKNYVVTEGFVKLKLYWTPIVPKGAKEQVVNVIVKSDGTISLSDKDIEKYGARAEGINFNRCITYVGGIRLEDALKSGRWRDKESPSKAQKRAAASSHSKDDRPDHGHAGQVQRDIQQDKDVVSVPKHQPSRLLDRGDTRDHGSRPVSESESQLSRTHADGDIPTLQGTRTSPSSGVMHASTDHSRTAAAVSDSMFPGEQRTSSIDGRSHESQKVKNLRSLLDLVGELCPQGLKIQILNARSTIDRLEGRIYEYIGVNDQEDIARIVEVMADTYYLLLGYHQSMVKMLYNGNADRDLLELCVKEYQTNLQELYLQGVNICAAEFLPECKSIICEVCKYEFDKYEFMFKMLALGKLSAKVVSFHNDLEHRFYIVGLLGPFSSALGAHSEVLKEVLEKDGNLKDQSELVKTYQDDLKKLLELSIDLYELRELEGLEILHEHRDLIYRICSNAIEQYIRLINDEQLNALPREINYLHGELTQKFHELDNMFSIDRQQVASQGELTRSDVAQEGVIPKQRVVQSRDDSQSSDSEEYDSDDESDASSDKGEKIPVGIAPAVEQVVP